MNGGPIGGINQKGKWKLGARFNRKELIRRCERIVDYRDRIRVSREDGIEFIERCDVDATLLFIDPPYFAKGKTLYLNALDEEYHERLAKRLKAMPGAAWVLTYDDCPEIRRMYRDWASVRPFALRYVASERRPGREIMITPEWMRVPTSQESLAISW